MINVTIETKCDAPGCDVSTGITHTLDDNTDIGRITAALGFQVLNGRAYCDRHHIVVFEQGEQCEEGHGWGCRCDGCDQCDSPVVRQHNSGRENDDAPISATRRRQQRPKTPRSELPPLQCTQTAILGGATQVCTLERHHATGHAYTGGIECPRHPDGAVIYRTDSPDADARCAVDACSGMAQAGEWTFATGDAMQQTIDGARDAYRSENPTATLTGARTPDEKATLHGRADGVKS